MFNELANLLFFLFFYKRKISSPESPITEGPHYFELEKVKENTEYSQPVPNLQFYDNSKSSDGNQHHPSSHLLTSQQNPLYFDTGIINKLPHDEPVFPADKNDDVMEPIAPRESDPYTSVHEVQPPIGVKMEESVYYSPGVILGTQQIVEDKKNEESSVEYVVVDKSNKTSDGKRKKNENSVQEKEVKVQEEEYAVINKVQAEVDSKKVDKERLEEYAVVDKIKHG